MNTRSEKTIRKLFKSIANVTAYGYFPYRTEMMLQKQKEFLTLPTIFFLIENLPLPTCMCVQNLNIIKIKIKIETETKIR